MFWLEISHRWCYKSGLGHNRQWLLWQNKSQVRKEEEQVRPAGRKQGRGMEGELPRFYRAMEWGSSVLSWNHMNWQESGSKGSRKSELIMLTSVSQNLFESERYMLTPIYCILRKGILGIPGSGDGERATVGMEELRGWTRVRVRCNCGDRRSVPLVPSHSAGHTVCLRSGGAVLKVQATYLLEAVWVVLPV